jgi:Flp pilus assembly pilin Flp
MQEDSGQDLIEYALIVGLTGLSIVSLTQGIANGISNDYNLIGTSFANNF